MTEETPLTNIVADAIEGYKAGLAGDPMGFVSEAFDSGWIAGNHARAVASPTPSQPPGLTDEQIKDAVFAVLRKHNDDRLWRALTYERGPYDVTFASLALTDIGRAIERLVRGEKP